MISQGAKKCKWYSLQNNSEKCKKSVDKFREMRIIVFVRQNTAGLCNGSTADSDSVCEGSNPSPAARKPSVKPPKAFSQHCNRRYSGEREQPHDIWECVDPIHEPFEQKPGKPCNTGDSGTLFLGQIRRKNRFDHMFDHIQKNLCFYPCYDDMTKNRIPGCSSVDRTRGLGPRGREFEPLHSDQNPSEIIDFRGIFLSLITAAQNLSCLTLSIYTDDCLGLPPQRRCPHRQAAAGGIPCGSR